NRLRSGGGCLPRLCALQVDQPLAVLDEMRLDRGDAGGQFDVLRILRGELFNAEEDRLQVVQIRDLVNGRAKPSQLFQICAAIHAESSFNNGLINRLYAYRGAAVTALNSCYWLSGCSSITRIRPSERNASPVAVRASLTGF